MILVHALPASRRCGRQFCGLLIGVQTVRNKMVAEELRAKTNISSMHDVFEMLDAICLLWSQVCCLLGSSRFSG